MCEQTHTNSSKQVHEHARQATSSSTPEQTRGIHHHSIFGFRCNCDECKGLKREGMMTMQSGREDERMDDTTSAPTVATCSKEPNNHHQHETEEEGDDDDDDENKGGDKKKSEEDIDEPMPQQRQLETKPTALIAPFATTLELDDQESNITQVDSEIQNIARSIQFNLSNGVLLSDSDDTQQSANNNPSPVPPNSDQVQVQANTSSIGEEQLQTPVTRKRLLSNASELKRPTLRRNTNQFNQF